MTDRMVSSAAPLQGAINAALESLARGLALELAPTRVNTVSPGLIETPLWSRMPEKDRAAMYAGAADRLPARSVGQPQDIANAVMFLAATPFATGSNVRVDAGGTIASSKPLSSTPPKRRRQGRRSDTKRPVAA